MQKLSFFILILSVFSHGLAAPIPKPAEGHGLGIVRVGGDTSEGYLLKIAELIKEGSQDQNIRVLKSYFSHFNPQAIYEKIQEAALFVGYENDHIGFLEKTISQYGESLNVFTAIDGMKRDFENGNLPEYLKQHVSIINKLLFFYGSDRNIENIIFYIKESIINLCQNGAHFQNYFDYLNHLTHKIAHQNGSFNSCNALKKCSPSMSDFRKISFNNGVSFFGSMNRALTLIKSLTFAQNYPVILKALENINGISQFEHSVRNYLKFYNPENQTQEHFIELMKSTMIKNISTQESIIGGKLDINEEYVEDESIRLKVLVIFEKYTQSLSLDRDLTADESATWEVFMNSLRSLKEEIYQSLPEQQVSSFEQQLYSHLIKSGLQPSPQSEAQHQAILVKVSDILEAVLKVSY
jgi:hypothetical protein